MENEPKNRKAFCAIATSHDPRKEDRPTQEPFVLLFADVESDIEFVTERSQSERATTLNSERSSQ